MLYQTINGCRHRAPRDICIPRSIFCRHFEERSDEKSLVSVGVGWNEVESVGWDGMQWNPSIKHRHISNPPPVGQANPLGFRCASSQPTTIPNQKKMHLPVRQMHCRRKALTAKTKKQGA